MLPKSNRRRIGRSTGQSYRPPHPRAAAHHPGPPRYPIPPVIGPASAGLLRVVPAAYKVDRVDHEEQQHRGRHRRPDDEEQAREIAESVEADLPPTELSVEEDAAARAVDENR